MRDKLEERFNADFWTTLNGEVIHITEMKDSHLMNTLKMIARGGENSAYGYGARWYPKLKSERIRRENASKLR